MNNFEQKMEIATLLKRLLALGLELQDIDTIAHKVGQRLNTYIWLTKHLHVYVSTDGTDSTDDVEQGLVSTKPFKTPQYALQYVSSVYNLNQYNAYIHLAAGSYGVNTILSLPSYVSTTGTIVLQGQSDRAAVVLGMIHSYRGGAYNITDLTIQPKYKNSDGNSYAVVAGKNNNIQLINVAVLCDQLTTSAVFCYRAESGGQLAIVGTQRHTVTMVNNPQIAQLFSAAANGQIYISQDVQIVNSCTINAVAMAHLGGMIVTDKLVSSGLGRAPLITATGTVTGSRFIVETNGIIRVDAVTAGDLTFFPGSVAGTISTGGQYLAF